METVWAKTSLRNVRAITAALLLAGLAGTGRAWAGPELATLRVVDRDTGRELQMWSHNGRLFVAGQPDARYSLRVINNTGGRILAIMAVDGVNIVTGETAGYRQGGYVLAPHQVLDVNGWRKSTSEIAAFSFTGLSQSYAAETGRPLDVGVIGVAVFREKPEPPPPLPPVTFAAPIPIMPPLPVPPALPASVPPAPKTHHVAANRHRARRVAEVPPPPLNIPAPPLPLPPVKAPVAESVAPPQPVPPSPPAPPAPAAPPAYASAAQDQAASRRFAAPQGEKLGTAHGPRERSTVTIIRFERATPYPEFVRQIEYDSYPNLVAAGVIPNLATTDSHPRPFPSGQDSMKFVPDPPRQP